MGFRFHYAEVLIIFIFLLDIIATISAINQHTSFWFNPLSAASFEGNPVAAQAIGMGLIYSISLSVAWILVAMWLFDKKNWFRFYVFSGFVSLHAFGLASWLFVDTKIFNLPIIFVTALVFGYLAGKTWHIKEFLDKKV